MIDNKILKSSIWYTLSNFILKGVALLLFQYLQDY